MNYRAIHMGGNWGTNHDGGVEALPSDYFEWLRDLNVNWVGISVAIYVDDSTDSTVERKYSGVDTPTFTDDTLVKLIGAFRQHGFNVYLTLAFENQSQTPPAHPFKRWELGDPDIYNEDPNVLPEYWPWALNHPDHERFISDFWQTYTEQAVHFGELAQQVGVGLYSLGTETDRLFRTRTTGGVGPINYRDEIRTMVQSVRQVYSGLITYDMGYDALVNSGFFSTANTLWDDAGLDVIGISAYFSLADAAPTTELSVQKLESRWETIFARYLIPMQAGNPGKTILFTEFGYTDSLAAPYQPSADEFAQRVLIDKNNNGLDDGQEMQANIYAALFHVMDRHPGVLSGAFLWGNMMAGDAMWNGYFGQARGFDIRNKLSEEVVREKYSEWRDRP
jgi:hypothetical protein